eukprot:14862990-Alexandrium_andersonii.AAC.1
MDEKDVRWLFRPTSAAALVRGDSGLVAQWFHGEWLSGRLAFKRRVVATLNRLDSCSSLAARPIGCCLPDHVFREWS